MGKISQDRLFLFLNKMLTKLKSYSTRGAWALGLWIAHLILANEIMFWPAETTLEGDLGEKVTFKFPTSLCALVKEKSISLSNFRRYLPHQ